MNRRASIRLIVLSTATAALTSCGKGGDSTPTSSKPPEHTVRDLLEDFAIVGVFIGKQLEKLPHPAMRVTGLVLETTSELIVTYISIERATEEQHNIKVSVAQSRDLQTAGKVVLQVKNGGHEERCIDAVHSRM